MNELVHLAKQRLEEIRLGRQETEDPDPLDAAGPPETTTKATEATKAPGFLAEPASGRPVYWEDARGVIQEGLAVLLGRDGTTFWVGIETTDGFQWVRDDRLRSRAAFEAQRPLRAVEPIRERRAP
jgi:hypothetical protein